VTKLLSQNIRMQHYTPSTWD